MFECFTDLYHVVCSKKNQLRKLSLYLYRLVVSMSSITVLNFYIHYIGPIYQGSRWPKISEVPSDPELAEEQKIGGGGGSQANNEGAKQGSEKKSC